MGKKKLWTIDSLIWFSFAFCLKFWELWIVGLVYVEKLFSSQILFSFSYSLSAFLSHGILNMQWFSGGNIVSWAAWSASSGTCSFVMNYLLIFLGGNFQLWMSFSILGHISGEGEVKTIVNNFLGKSWLYFYKKYKKLVKNLII